MRPVPAPRAEDGGWHQRIRGCIRGTRLLRPLREAGAGPIVAPIFDKVSSDAEHAVGECNRKVGVVPGAVGGEAVGGVAVDSVVAVVARGSEYGTLLRPS